MIEPEKQARLFSHYLLRRPPTDTAIRLYIGALSDQPELTDRDRRLLAFAFAHPGTIGYLDGYLGFFRPAAELRRRLYLMFSILETMPENVDYFLPQQRSPLYIIKVGGVGIRAIFRLAIGAVIVQAGRL